ncbi:MAG: hypothetical protein IH959_08575 [Chloroflexi bacterium]|nr:hypothetical protein [Chloroflexota bacterium]
MNENDDTPTETLLCGRCVAACDPEDNFCRHCGLSLQEQRLPSVSDSGRVPAVWQPSLPTTIAKGAAVVAAGAVAQRLLGGLVRQAFRRGPRTVRTPAKRSQRGIEPREEAMPEDAQLVSETFLLRRIRIRR